MAQTELVSETTLRIRRTMNAPRELVFRAWTDSGQLLNWWRAKADFSTPFADSPDVEPPLRGEGPEAQYPFVPSLPSFTFPDLFPESL